jgi:urate oxidase
MSRLAWNRYGKSRIRLVHVSRARDPHDLIDLTIDVQLEGTFDGVYVDGDNQLCLPTDTMKNTVYALARRHPITHVEGFATMVVDHFAAKPGVLRTRVSAAEARWERLSAAGRPHPHAFVQGGSEQWTTIVTRDGDGLDIASGLTNLVALKTTDSAFRGYPRDEYTTLAETPDRILATSITAVWKYRRGTTSFAVRESIRAALLETFALHHSESVQHTLYAMGQAALGVTTDVTEITLTLPNRHHLLIDLEPFGLENPNEVFVATEQPFGLIEATIRR